jgi:hypothetical protein
MPIATVAVVCAHVGAAPRLAVVAAIAT